VPGTVASFAKPHASASATHSSIFSAAAPRYVYDELFIIKDSSRFRRNPKEPRKATTSTGLFDMRSGWSSAIVSPNTKPCTLLCTNLYE